MNAAPALKATGLVCGPRDFVGELSFEVQAGEFVCVLGPNGSGKTTLLRALTGLIPHRGELRVQGVPFREISRRQFSRRVAVVAQWSVPAFDFTVEEVVAAGRFPYQGLLPNPLAGDRRAVAEALEQTGLSDLRSQKVTELSAGAYQRVTIARALAQQSPILLLDEPTSHLDLAHQIQVFELLSRWNTGGERTVLCVSHDLNLAAEFTDRVLLLREGKIFAEGVPSEVLTEANLLEVYGARVRVSAHPESGRPTVSLQRNSPR